MSIVKIRKLSTFIYTLGPGEVAVIFGVQRQYFRSLSAFHHHQLSRYVGWKHLEILGPLVGFELMLTVISVSRDFPTHRWILSWWQRDPGKARPVQTLRSNPSLSRAARAARAVLGKMFVPFIHWLGRAGEKLRKMFTSEIFAMNAIQTDRDFNVIRWSLTIWVCDVVMLSCL